MAPDVLHGIELEKRLGLIIGERDAVRHAHIRSDDEGRFASVRALATKTVQPSEFGVAEPARWKAAVEVGVDQIGIEKMTVAIEPLNHPPHIIGMPEPVLSAGGGMGQAEMHMTLQAETGQVIEQEVESEIQPIDGKSRLGPRPHDGEETVQSLGCFRRNLGLDRVSEITYPGKPLEGRPGEMAPELLESGRAYNPIGENCDLETTLEQVEDEIDALRVKSRLSAPKGYLPLIGHPEKIRQVDEVLPSPRPVGRGGHLVRGEGGGEGTVAVCGQQ
jgi:hypothetical protein